MVVVAAAAGRVSSPPPIRKPATPSPPNLSSTHPSRDDARFGDPPPSYTYTSAFGRPATRHAISLAGSRHTVVLSTPGRKSAALGTGSGAGSVCENCVDSPPKNAPAPVRLLDASPGPHPNPRIPRLPSVPTHARPPSVIVSLIRAASL